MNDLLIIGYGNYRNHHSIVVKDIISTSSVEGQSNDDNQSKAIVDSSSSSAAATVSGRDDMVSSSNKISISYDLSSSSNVFQFRSTKLTSNDNDNNNNNKSNTTTSGNNNSSSISGSGDHNNKLFSDIFTSFTLLGSHGMNQSANGIAGDYILGVVNKDVFNPSRKAKKASTILAWRYGRENPEADFYAPEQLSIIRATSNASFILAGASSGMLYIWEVGSGNLIHVCKAHYRALTALAITPDDGFVITGGDDALIHVWRLIDLVSFTNQPLSEISTKRGVPMCTFSDHTLSITGITAIFGGRILSCSQDHTCKLWSINQTKSKDKMIKLISSFSFKGSVSCAAITDVCERELFVGTNDGIINIIPLISASSSSLNDKKSTKSNEILTGGHGKFAITCLNYSSNLLFSGDQDGVVCMWDVESRQLLTRLQGSNISGPVRFLSCIPKNMVKEQYMFKGLQHHTPSQLIKLNPLKRYPESKEEEEASRKSYCAEIYSHSNYMDLFQHDQQAEKRQRKGIKKDTNSSIASTATAVITNDGNALQMMNNASIIESQKRNEEEMKMFKERIEKLENINQRLLKLIQMKD